MIYWLEKLKWRVRKALGLTRGKRIRTIDDVVTFDQALFWKIIILTFAVILAMRAGEFLARVWWWFFPRVVRAPMEYL